MSTALQQAITAIKSEINQLQTALTALTKIDTAPRTRRTSGQRAPKKAVRHWSPAARKAAAARMRKRWAERRRQKKAKGGA